MVSRARAVTFGVEGDVTAFQVDDDKRLTAGRGGAGALLVALERNAFSDLMQDVASTLGI